MVDFTIYVTGIHLEEPIGKIGLRHNTKITPHTVRGNDNAYGKQVFPDSISHGNLLLHRLQG